MIKNTTGIKWDCPDSSGKGGTTTTGNVARQLLHNKDNRRHIINEMPEDHRERIDKFGMHLSVIIRVLSSKLRVNVKAYKEHCKEFYLFLLSSFTDDQGESWVNITPSLHKVLSHSWELIESNDEHGLGSFDESGLEGNNKILRNIRLRLSRKTSQTHNLIDTLNRMWISSDPNINTVRQSTKPMCKHCNVKGHSTRYCHTTKSNSSTVLSLEDKLFESLIYE